MKTGKKSLSIQVRLIGAFCLLSAITTGACVAAYYFQLTRDFREKVRRELEVTRQFQIIAGREQQNRALLIAGNLAADSGLKENIGARDASQMDNLLWTRSLELDADFITVMDENGAALTAIEPGGAGGGRWLRHGDPLFLDALFQKALAGGTPTGLEICRPGIVCMNAYSQVINRRKVIGYVKVGIALDDKFAQTMKKSAGADFIMVRGGSVASSSLPGPRISDVEAASLVAEMDAARRNANIRPSAPQSATGTIFPAGAESAPQESPVMISMNFRGKPYVFQASALKDVAGRELGLLFIGRDTVDMTRAWSLALRALLAIAAAALIFSVGLGYALSVRQTRPLRMLLKRVREITAGELTGAISVARYDEVGRLAAAFNEMTETLAERDARLRESAEELRSNQEQIIQSGKLAAIGELAAGVAHEIGNPLSAISGYAQMLKKGNLSPDIQKEYVKEIENEAGFIERIIEDLLDFARPSAEGPLCLDMNEVVESAYKTASAHKAFSNVSLKKEFSKEPPVVFANRKEMLQVCLNLFMNAAQAMKGGGELSISTTMEKNAVIIKVSDTGPGVEEAVRDKIFDPFFTTKPPGVGTGLGLSICYRIIEKYKGSLTFHNRKGGGADFMVTLPRAPEGKE